MNAVTASAPGSLMLFGEHAVLRGEPAIVCAIARRLRVTARPRSDGEVRVRSALGTLRFAGRRIPDDPRFAFVLHALRVAAPPAGGVELRIESAFSSKLGFGSSAAVTVAALAALDWLGRVRLSRRALFRRALEVIRRVQGAGSGADAAASVWGGAVAFRQEGGRIRRLPFCAPLVAVYSGRKTPTPEAIRKVNALCSRHPGLTRDIFALMGRCAREAAGAMRAGDLPRIGRLMNLHHGFQDALGLNTGELARRVFRLRADPGIRGAKISGAGLGDCAIGVGGLRGPGRIPGAMALSVDPEGVRFEPGSPRVGRARRLS